MAQTDDRDKRVIGLYGEMRLAMELHERGWQVYRAYIDEKIDFVILKCYCDNCKEFTEALTRTKIYKNKNRKTVTNLCSQCREDSLRMLVRYIQVKTSEGVDLAGRTDRKKFSFHPKIRYHLKDGRVFYVWIAVFNKDIIHFYVFKTQDVSKFDDINLDTYQITDNQKTELTINREGEITKKGRIHDYSVFDEFRNNFSLFDEIIDPADSPYSSEPIIQPIRAAAMDLPQSKGLFRTEKIK